MDACAAPARAPRPPHGAHISLPSFRATDTRRYLVGLKISGTIPIDVGQMTELYWLYVFPLFPRLFLALRRPAALLAPPVRRASFAPFTRVVRSPRSPSLRSPSLRAHSQVVGQQPDHGCCLGHLRHQGPRHSILRSLPQSGLDKRRDVPGVPQHWTVQASRHVHWALSDALTDTSTDYVLANNTRADPATDATRLRDCFQRKSLLIRSAA